MKLADWLDPKDHLSVARWGAWSVCLSAATMAVLSVPRLAAGKAASLAEKLVNHFDPGRGLAAPKVDCLAAESAGWKAARTVLAWAWAWDQRMSHRI